MRKGRLTVVLLTTMLTMLMAISAAVSILLNPQIRMMWSTMWSGLTTSADSPDPGPTIEVPPGRSAEPSDFARPEKLETNESSSDVANYETTDSTKAGGILTASSVSVVSETTSFELAPTEGSRGEDDRASDTKEASITSVDEPIDYRKLSDDIRQMADALERFNDKLSRALAGHKQALELAADKNHSPIAGNDSVSSSKDPEVPPPGDRHEPEDGE